MRTFFLTALIAFVSISFAQTEKFLMHDGINREYLEYVPALYDGSESVPLVLCLHGLGDTKENFFSVGMNYIADTANFIVLVPEALDDVVFGQPTGTAWNSGASAYGIVLSDDVDDVGFLTQIIENTKLLYNVDDDKIFVMGFSMGGFMTNRLACEMSDYFAAAASVAGTQGTALTCSPSQTIPFCHIHGTNDGTVAYTGNSYGNDAEDLVEYWRSHNQCDLTPSIENLPDIAADGRTVEHYIYANGTDNATVELYKVNNADHEWMSLPTNDISYGFEIWKFFRKHMPVSQDVNDVQNQERLRVFPNPLKDYIIIDNLHFEGSGEIEIYNALGQKKEINIETYSNKYYLNLSGFESGVYYVKYGQVVEEIVKK